ncbi:MAG: DUF2807 domain-containing protein [Cyclobacteriaceae bacterium]
MRTSRKILAITGGLLLIYFVAAMIVIRHDMRLLIAQEGKEQTYFEVAIEPFEKVMFSSNWNAVVKYGLKHKVEIQRDPNSDWTPSVFNENEKLTCWIDSSYINQVKLKARITTPYLDLIQVEGNSEIEFSNFNGDSLWIVMRDSSSVTGKENKFVFLSQVASGRAQLNLIDDPSK